MSICFAHCFVLRSWDGTIPLPRNRIKYEEYTAFINFEQERAYDLMHEAKAEIKIICKFQHPFAEIKLNKK
jgi:hypothetical protein